mgnify:CR=1 FL=1
MLACVLATVVSVLGSGVVTAPAASAAPYDLADLGFEPVDNMETYRAEWDAAHPQ